MSLKERPSTFFNIYKFGIKDIRECIKVVNFFYKLIGTVLEEIKLAQLLFAMTCLLL